MSTEFAVGHRVRVKPLDVEKWAQGAPASMSGRTGTITEVRRPTYRPPLFCVTFDQPAPRWWGLGAKHAAFHFEAEELEVL